MLIVPLIVQGQLKICLLFSVAASSVFQLGLESMARHHSYFLAFGPWLNVIEDP